MIKKYGLFFIGVAIGSLITGTVLVLDEINRDRERAYLGTKGHPCFCDQTCRGFSLVCDISDGLPLSGICVGTK